MRNRASFLFSILALVGSASLRAETTPAYFRYPDIWNGRIVFAAEGDLWSTSDQGGPSRRLTSHPGTEYFPRFSPDGKSIAFTGEYDGNRDVYVMSADGGEPRRLTWHPASDEVLGWTPDSKKVLFRSRAGNPMAWEVYSVAADGKSEPEKLPIGWVARLAIDPQSGMWAFNRKSWETATWKRYRGGTAPDIWVGHPDKGDFKSVTPFTGTNAFPMWHGGRVFFLSDLGGTANLWSMKPDGSDRKRLTDFKGWDARWPSIGPDGRIVFTLGADIHLFDPKTGTEKKVDVDLPSDRTLTRVRYPAAAQNLTSFDLSPKGDRLLVTTRGKVFSVAVKNGVTLPVTHEDGARAIGASFADGGKKVVYVTDVPREEEIRVADAWGRGASKVVKPAGGSGWHFPPVASPDGKWIAYADQTQALYVVSAEGGKPKLVDRSPQSEIREYVFSPDGRWLAYSKSLPTDYSSIFVYDTRSGKSAAVTSPTTNDATPTWDPKGRYLYFISERATNPVLDTRDLQNVELKNNVVMAVLLRKDVKNPVANLRGLPGDDEDADKKDAKSGDKKDGEKKEGEEKDEEAKKKDAPPEPVEIDLDGISSRVVQIPLDRGRYRALYATAKNLFTLSVPLKGMAERGDDFGSDEVPADLTLMSFDLEKRKGKTFLDGVSEFVGAARAEKLAVMKKKGEIYVVDAGSTPPPAADLPEAKVSLDGVVVEIDPQKEWAQIYYEGWRQMRDFFWDEGMGQVDWKSVRDRYATLLPRLGTRDDLRDLMGELIGELNNSHTYVFGGDPGVRPTRVTTGLLGADVKRDGNAFRVTRVYRGDPADNVRSPLDEPGVNVSEGDQIVAVNHVPFASDRSFYASFENLAGKEVVLSVKSKAADEPRDVTVKTLASDSELRYADWVRRNREYVATKTGGKIAYIHLPDMGSNGQTRFNTWFYPQLDKEGMVVDCRWNGGGFVSQMILERFRRKVLTFDRARGGGTNTYPYRTLNGPFVVLTNEFAGSDGDIFPAMVQLEGLAPVIGMRSWGGVVGIRGDKRLVDGGLVTEPEFALWQPKKGWSIENLGVVPDIEVQNTPQELGKGVDTQLDRAIAEVSKLRDLHPPLKPEWGPVRDRRREAFGEEMKMLR